MSKRISEVVHAEIEEAKRNVLIMDGFSFNQHDILKRINYYINDQYLERNDDAIFWNLATYRITHFAKNIDLDTKDLMPYGIGETNFVQAWILKMRFQKWLDDNKFALTLNDLSEGLATYGSHVWKIVDVDGKKKPEEPDLMNLYFDQTAKSIRDVPVVEMHYFSKHEMEQKKEVWDNVEKAIALGKEAKCEKYEVWERFGSFEDKYMHVIGYGKGEQEQIFFEEEMDEEDCPYYDFHLGKYRKTWLRQGVVQRLFKLQERVNQLVNQNAKTTEIASLLLLRTAQAENTGNVLTQLETGQVINSSDMQQIQLQNPGIALFIQELQQIEQQADKLCLTPEVITGDAMPSGTPFRSIATITNAAKSAFGYIRQSVGESVSYLMKDVILPSVVKDWNKGDIIEIAGDEEDQRVYDQLMEERMMYDTQKKDMLEGRMTSPEELAMIPGAIEQNIGRVGRKIKYPKQFFNFDYGIKLNVTGEAVDKSQQNDAYGSALNYITANPAIGNIPLFKQYLENNGISYWKLTANQIQQIQQGATGATPQPPQEDKLMSMVNS